MQSTKSESGYDDSMSIAGRNSRDWRRWLPRFSMRQLLLATTFVAVGCYALRWASPWWAIVLFYLCLGLVIGGILIAINRPGEPRSFWSGFAVCAIAHGLLIFHPGLDKGIPPLIPKAFVTTRLSAYAYDQTKPQLRVQPIRVDHMALNAVDGRRGGADPPYPSVVPAYLAGADGYFYSTGPGQFSVLKEDFIHVAHGLWTLLLAYVGGLVSLVLYRSRGKETADSAADHG
jgi:hypothetical protein